MSILESMELAVKNIVSSKTRTLLTMLGIIIGVAAVIVIVGLGNGLKGYVTDSFSDLGTDTLTVTVQSRGSTRSLSVDDMYRIVSENSQYLDKCSPTVTMPGLVKIGSDTADSTMATGVSEDYLSIKHYDISKGRDLQYSDIAMRSKVCVVGAYVDRAYFGGNAVGQTLRVRGQTLTVVGVIQQQSDDLEEGGTDDCLFLPYSVAERMAGSVNAYTVTMQDEDHMDESVNALESALYEVFASDDYYTVTSMAEMLDTMTGMINILVYVLAGIAAISLVVGGIGIMNIMLVSVTVTQSGTQLSAISKRSLSGTVNSAGTRFAGYSFADNVEILDTDGDGGYARIYPSRLAGYSLTDDDVLFYTLDSSGSIDCLILDEATGDTYTYAFVTQATSKTDGNNLSGSYTYLQNGQSHSVSGQQTYSVKVGGARLTFSDNGSLKGMRQLSSVNLTGLTSLTATAGSSKYALAEDVMVLLRDSGQQGYYPTTLSAVNSTDYSLVGWYDNQGASAGGRIRILVATKK